MYDSVFHADSLMGDFKFQIEPSEGVSVNLLISNCHFTETNLNVFPAVPPSSVVFKDSIFKSAVMVEFSYNEEHLMSTLNISNCTGDALIFSANFYSDSNCQITDSNFTNSKFDLSSMLVYTEVKVNILVSNCVFSKATVDQQLKVHLRGSYNGAAPYKSVKIKDSFFQECTLGALYVSGFAFTLIRTRFADNFIGSSISYQPGISAALTVQSYSIEIVNCTFVNNTAPSGIPNSLKIDFMSEVFFQMSNTLIVSGKTSIGDVNNVAFISECSTQQAQIFQNNSFYCAKPDYYLFIYGGGQYSGAQMITCTRCGGLTYNALDQSYVKYNEKVKKTVHNITCYACPYQASCANSIQSRGNYWGMLNSTGYVNFYLCPPFYCCSSLRTCSSYNTCVNNRQGRLCGTCMNGYSISIFNKCVRTDQCTKTWFWPAYSIFCVLVFLAFLYVKDVLRFLKTKLCSLFCSSNIQSESSQNGRVERDSPTTSSLHNSRRSNSINSASLEDNSITTIPYELVDDEDENESIETENPKTTDTEQEKG